MEIDERSTREARQEFADVINAAIHGRITFITSRGRRVAAVVPLAIAEEAIKDDPTPPRPDR